MATINPFAGSDDSKATVWERGYLSGFGDPAGGEHFPGPIAEGLLDAYRKGEEAGRADAGTGPVDIDGAWVAPDFDFGELGEHVVIHALGVALEKVGVAAGGLIALVLTVVTIPGDVSLTALEPDSGPLDTVGQEQEGNTYLAVCPLSDHGLVLVGVTADGFWTGPVRSSFAEAVSDMRAHGHAEAFVARCSVSEATCGPVWAVQ